MKKLTILACWLLALLLTSFPARAQEQPETFVFTPQWTAQAQFAGYYVALEKGFYAEEGLQVVIEHASVSQIAENRIQEGKSDAATMQLAQAVGMVDQGVDVVNILQTSMNNGLVIISRTEDGASRLPNGSKIATWRAGFDQIPLCMTSEQHLEYEWVQSAGAVNLFVAGAVDAMLGMSYNEYYQVIQTGLLNADAAVFRFKDHGYNIQEDGVYMMRSVYEKDPDRALRFARASRRGWTYAAEHPEEALKIVMTYVRRNRVATNAVLQKLMLDEVLRLQLDPDTGERSFTLRRDMTEAVSRMLYVNGMISREIQYEDLLP